MLNNQKLTLELGNGEYAYNGEVNDGIGEIVFIKLDEQLPKGACVKSQFIDDKYESRIALEMKFKKPEDLAHFIWGLTIVHDQMVKELEDAAE